MCSCIFFFFSFFFKIQMSLIVFMNLSTWRVRRSTLWTAAWRTTCPTLLSCGLSAPSTSSSPSTFLHGPVTPALRSRSSSGHLLLKITHARGRIVEDIFAHFFFFFFNCRHRSSCWQKSGLEWTSFHSPRSIPKSLTVKASRNATCSNQEKAKRTARQSSTLCWSTSTSGLSRRLVSMHICGGFMGMCEQEKMPFEGVLQWRFSFKSTWGIPSLKLRTGI